MDTLDEIASEPVSALFGWHHLPSVPFKFLPDFLKIPGELAVVRNALIRLWSWIYFRFRVNFGLR
jgi:hypothetical protein